jgi:hypothetical protein
LSIPSGSGGAFNTFIDQISRPALNGPGNISFPDKNDADEIFDAKLAARLAQPARPQTISQSAFEPPVDLPARLALARHPDAAPTASAEVTRLSPQAGNLPVVEPACLPTSAAAAPAGDVLAGEKFLDELESGLMQGGRSTRSQTAAFLTRPSNPKSDPSR